MDKRENNLKTIYLSGPIMDEHAGAARERKFVDREVDSANEIVEFDLLDVRNADIILVNYSRPSIGTSMEVFYASHVLGKFVVAFSPYEYRECSPWMVRYCTKILGSLEEAAEYIATHFSQEME